MKQNKNIPEGYKDSPLGIIPDEWEVKRLKDGIKELEAGVSVNSEKDATTTTNAGILKTSCISKGIFYPQEHKKIIIEEINKAKVNPRIGNLIISRMNTPELVGECGYVSSTFKDLFLPDRLWQTIFFDNSCFMPKYLSYILNTDLFKFKIKNIATGTSNSMKNITKEDWLSIKIATPPSDEQKRIIEILSTWDEAIEKQTTLIEKLKVRKRGLMQQLLTEKKRLPGFSGKWGGKKLKDIAERIIRKNIEGCKNIVTISAQKGFISQTDFFKKVVASENIENYYLVYKNEFCYNKSYSNGYPMGAIKRLVNSEKAVVTTLYICFKINPNLNIDFIEQYFEAGILNKGLSKIANEGGRAHGLLNVTPSDFFNISIKIPPVEEQNAIAKILCIANQETRLAIHKLDQLKKEKKGLMQVLLTGKKRV